MSPGSLPRPKKENFGLAISSRPTATSSTPTITRNLPSCEGITSILYLKLVRCPKGTVADREGASLISVLGTASLFRFVAPIPHTGVGILFLPHPADPAMRGQRYGVGRHFLC